MENTYWNDPAYRLSLKGITESPDTKYCSKCKLIKPLKDFTRNSRGRKGIHCHCRICAALTRKERRADGTNRDYRLRKIYGISSVEYDEMLAKQKGCCAICGRSGPGGRRRGHLVVDHNHVTGQIRGLLCHPCNTALGMFNDDSQVLVIATEYLKRFE